MNATTAHTGELTMAQIATIDHGALQAQLQPADPMISMIERIALDPTVPLDRLEQMLAMKERLEDRNRALAREDREYDAKRAYFKAMSACQNELPVVIKRQRNTHTNSNYADLAAIEEQAMPVIHRHGFGVTFQPDGYNEKGELQIKWEITHDEGHSRSDVAGIPVDGAGSQGKVNKTGTQAFGSTATYGRRYLLCMLFNISTGDDKDGNADHPEPISEQQLAELRDLIEAINADADKVCARYKIEALPDLPAKLFPQAVQALKDWARNQK